MCSPNLMLVLKADTLNFFCKGQKYKQNMCLHLHFCAMGFQWLESTFSFKKDINIEDLIKTSRPVLIEFSAACDFSQNKKELKNIYWEL